MNAGRATSSILWGEFYVCYSGSYLNGRVPSRIDGALEPWLDTLSNTILRLYALPDPTPAASTSKLPPPRVVLKRHDGDMNSTPSPPQASLSATVKRNERITEKDWYQDVRHIEFQLGQDVA